MIRCRVCRLSINILRLPLKKGHKACSSHHPKASQRFIPPVSSPIASFRIEKHAFSTHATAPVGTILNDETKEEDKEELNIRQLVKDGEFQQVIDFFRTSPEKLEKNQGMIGMYMYALNRMGQYTQTLYLNRIWTQEEEEEQQQQQLLRAQEDHEDEDSIMTTSPKQVTREQLYIWRHVLEALEKEIPHRPNLIRVRRQLMKEITSACMESDATAWKESRKSKKLQDHIFYIFSCSNTMRTGMDCIHAYNALKALQMQLKPFQYAQFLQRLNQNSFGIKHAQVFQVFDDFWEKYGTKRSHNTSSQKKKHFLTNPQLQACRHVLWFMMQRHTSLNTMAYFYGKYVKDRSNYLQVFEFDPFNFLLHVECLEILSKLEEDSDISRALVETTARNRIQTVLDALQRVEFFSSYSTSHALFRLVFQYPKLFVRPSKHWKKEFEEQDVEEQVATQVVEFLRQWEVALAPNRRRTALAVSVACTIGRSKIVLALLKQDIPIDPSAFAHAIASIEDETLRKEILDMFLLAKEKYPEIMNSHEEDEDEEKDQDGHEGCTNNISNYLLLHAARVQNLPQMMELLQEMQLKRHRANSQTIDTVFDVIAKKRLELGTKLFRLNDLFSLFSHVIPRTKTNVSLAIQHNLQSGELEEAMTVLRSALWSTEVVLGKQIYSQLLYPCIAIEMESKEARKWLKEIESLYLRQFPDGNLMDLYSLVLNMCHSSDNFHGMLAVLYHLQEASRNGIKLTLSKKSTNRIFNIIGVHLKMLEESAITVEASSAAAGDIDTDATEDENEKINIITYDWLLEEFPELFSWDPWTIGKVIIRSKTNHLNDHVVEYIKEANQRGLLLERTAYAVAIKVLLQQKDLEEVKTCQERMKEAQIWTFFQEKYPNLVEQMDQST